MLSPELAGFSIAFKDSTAEFYRLRMENVTD
jgi:hypothetical protein